MNARFAIFRKCRIAPFARFLHPIPASYSRPGIQSRISQPPFSHPLSPAPCWESSSEGVPGCDRQVFAFSSAGPRFANAIDPSHGTMAHCTPFPQKSFVRNVHEKDPGNGTQCAIVPYNFWFCFFGHHGHHFWFFHKSPS
jgi:hypothetical protein